VKLREAVGGGPDCLHNLRHSFLYVWAPGATKGTEATLVEPHLREHFEIANPPPAYKAIVAALPAELVGNKARMVSLVQLMCQEMAAAFSTQGLLLPPWRQFRSMLSKWFPTNVKDTDMAQPVTPRLGSANGLGNRPLPFCGEIKKDPTDEWIPFQYGKY